MAYFTVKVKEQVSETKDGKPKFKKIPYLVKAESTVEAEANLTKHFEGLMVEWTVEDVITTKYQEVIL